MRRGVAIAALAAVATLLLAPPAYAASATLEPPGTLTAVSFDDLPACTVALSQPGAGLGWRATRTGVFSGPNGVWSIAPVIPCIDGAVPGYLRMGWAVQQVSGWVGSRGLNITVVNTLTCSASPDGSSPFTLTPTIAPPNSPVADPGFAPFFVMAGTGSPLAKAACPYLLKVVLVATQTPDQTVKISAIWKSSWWLTDDGGWSATEGTVDPFYEAPIVCTFAPTGGDIFALMGSAFEQAGSWFGCLFTPAGWDRSGKIDAAWENSALGDMGAAFNAVVPSSLGCGVVATFPWAGSTITLNTCAGDVAPGWVKIGVGWAIVLACGVASVRRVLWSVGSG